MISDFNAPGKDDLTSEQTRLFEAMVPHLMRAVRLGRRLRDLEIDNVALPENFAALPEAGLSTDANARVVRANATGNCCSTAKTLSFCGMAV